MTKEYIKIGDNLFKNKRHHYIKKSCDYCNSDFYCRKDKSSTKNTCNPVCYQSLVEKNKTYILSGYVNDIIVGSLLSDGSLGNTNNGKNYFWSHTCINEDYIDFLMSETGLELHKMIVKKGRYSINGKTGIAKQAYLFKSRCSVTFTKYRNEWYPNGKKIVPKNIKINPAVLLHWYLGDGSISDDCGITLSTDSFDEESLDFLLYELDKLGLNPTLNYLSNRIIIPNRRVIEFLTYIGECPVKSFEYKWKTFIKESYIDRTCLNCGGIFTAIYNHQKYCNPRCTIAFSRKR